MHSPRSHFDFSPAIGTPVTLQMASGGQHRFTATLFGALPGASILVHLAPGVLARTELKEDDGLVARCLVGREIVGFRTAVLQVCAQPYAYLHLSYPDDVQRVEIRKNERVPVSIPAQVHASGASAISATLVDLSASGAQLLAPDALGAVDDRIEFTVELSFAGASRELRIAAVIRNVTRSARSNSDEPQHRHGVQFDALKQEDMLLLLGHLYEANALRKRNAEA